MSSSSKNIAVSIAAIGMATSLLTYVFLVIYDGQDKFVPSVFVGALSAAICLKIVDCMARRAERTSRDRGIPAQSAVKPHVVLRLDGTEQLDTMLADRKQSGDTVDPAIEAAVAANAIARATSGPRTVSFVIFKVRPRTTDDVLWDMSRQGVRPATVIELVAFMKLMADLNLTAHFTRVVALGETFDVRQSPRVVALEFEPFFKSIDSLQMEWTGYENRFTALPRARTWGEDTAFLAVLE
jgi:hypothetical protein